MADHVRLGVNVDHVAMVRNVRGGAHLDPVALAKRAVEAGADGITAHLREDRRHIRDHDIDRLHEEVAAPLNLEMAATPELLAIALRRRPHAACLVPERREERTTEGGLDVVGLRTLVGPVVRELGAAGVRVSLFVEPDEAALDEAARMGAPVVELHTGTWCEALAAGDADRAAREFRRLAGGARHAARVGLEVHAGHGLDYASAEIIAALPQIAELNIGHFLIGEALSIGLGEAVRTMKAAIVAGRRRAAA